MSRLRALKASIHQRLAAALDEIFGLLHETITEYEEDMTRQQRLLDAALTPRRTGFHAEVQQLSVNHEEVSSEQQLQQWSPGQDQEDPPHIKEEQEGVWTSQEGEQLQGPEEADDTKFTFTPDPPGTSLMGGEGLLLPPFLQSCPSSAHLTGKERR